MRIFNLLPGLGCIQCATLILAGEDDPILPVEIQKTSPARFRPISSASNVSPTPATASSATSPTAGFKSFVTSLRDDQGYCRGAKPRGVRTRQRSSNVDARAVFPEYYTRE